MLSPVSYDAFAEPTPDRAPEAGIALCLSGGGYRAMLFHLGALWRLNELAYLRRLKRISSVSGGSITAAILGLAWKRLEFDGRGIATGFGHVVERVHALADISLQWKAIAGVLIPGSQVAERLARAYREHVTKDATLQDLPSDDEGPRFVLNATNVRTGVLARFSKAYFGEYRLGRILNPTFDMGTVVAASSAFPPFLSPYELDLDGAVWTGDAVPEFAELRDRLVLTDGGVYDNLGLETAFKRYDTLLVSDGGQRLAPDPDPDRDWARHAVRAGLISDSQVRSLRKHILVGAFKSGARKGTYFATYSDIEKYPESGEWKLERGRVLELAAVATELVKMPRGLQERLVNLGYVHCDVGLRSFMGEAARPASIMPYRAAAI